LARPLRTSSSGLAFVGHREYGNGVTLGAVMNDGPDPPLAKRLHASLHLSHFKQRVDRGREPSEPNAS
jgi:hypothetical protein